MQNPRIHWASCQKYFQQNVQPEEYQRWFLNVEFESFSPASRTLVLKVQNDYIIEYIEKNYIKLLRNAFINTFGVINLRWHVIMVQKEEKNPSDKASHTPSSKKGFGPTIDSDIDEKEGARLAALTSEAQSSERELEQAPGSTPTANRPDIDSQLNKEQTFSNFIEGDSNKLCRSVGLSIAEHPQRTQFNPFFIYGPSGCGKTHLVNAIGKRCKDIYPTKRVLYVSARTFQVQFTNANMTGKINDFIGFYQSIDMLIVDDIQEWANIQKTQETFFHIFNHLFRLNKHIILVSDRAPVQLEGMMDRLITRFSCGLVAEMEKPNLQLCVDILNRKIRRDGLTIPPDVVQYIAEHANGSVRDLEGIVHSLMAFSIVYNSNIDMRFVERIVKRAVKIDDQVLTIDDIIRVVCKQYNVTEVSIKGRTRKREIVLPRQIVMYLADKHIRMPAARIGRSIGGRDHSTVLHSIALITKKVKTDKEFANSIIALENELNIKP